MAQDKQFKLDPATNLPGDMPAIPPSSPLDGASWQTSGPPPFINEPAESESLAAPVQPPAASSATAEGAEAHAPAPPPSPRQDEAEPQRRVARRRPAGPVRNRLAANDDAPTIGGLIFALEQKPSAKPFRYAAIASCAWVLIGGALAWGVLSPQLATGSLAEILTRPATFLTAAALVIPTALFWFLAILVTRAEELKLRSATMTEVAIRLAEPDRMAEQSIASLGQSVRRQVGFMNDAVSRALGRAGELEALVHNEVAALERSYEENERKIRGLIGELSGERTALLSTSERVSETLKGLGTEIPALIEKLSGQQVTLARIIEGAGENLTSLEHAINLSSQRLETTVHETTGRIHSTIGDSTLRLEHTLTGGAQQLETITSTGAQRLEAIVTGSVAAIEGSLGGGSARLETMLATNVGAIEGALTGSVDRLENALGSHSQNLQGVLEDYTLALATALGSRSDMMQETFDQYLKSLDTSLSTRTDAIQTAFDGYMRTLDTSLANRTDNLQTVFEEYARALDSTLANRAHALDEQLVDRTRALDEAFTERLRILDESILRSTMAIDGAIGDKARALTSAMEAHAKTMSDTIGKQAVELDETLMHGINAVRRTSENITRQSIKAIEGLTSHSELLKNVSENLLSQVNSVTNRFESQGQVIMKAANALESANYKIDLTLQNRQQDLSRTLEHLSSKADQLGEFMEGYSSSLEGQLTEAEKRARLVAEQLKRGTETKSRAVISELERIKATTDAESDKMLDDLRQRFSSVSSEVKEQLTSLTSQVSETSDEVRRRTLTAAAELEAEQKRLREQIEHLPNTTRDSANAMRRALQDQLKALDQLSSLTTREAQVRDVSPPVAPSAGASLTQTYVGERRATDKSAAPTRSLSALTSTLTQELNARTRPLASGMAETPAASAAPLRPALQAPAPATPPPAAAPSHQPAPPSEGREAWSFGDLLARASRDEDPAPSLPGSPHPAGGAPVTGALQPAPFALNVDVIARALDAATAGAIWSRFQAGQRGFMVRSIYTPEGRSAFDEIQRRYKSDADLKMTVNRYLAEFELILKDAEGKDPSGRLTQGHLTSETGRVYLFLAHASGRLA